MVNRQLTDKLLASIAINPQFIDFPFANVLNLCVKIIDCGFLAIQSTLDIRACSIEETLDIEDNLLLTKIFYLVKAGQIEEKGAF